MLTNNMLLKGGFWATLINNFASGIGNYGWAIIVFTICLKLIMSPLDVLQRVQSQKQTKFMSVMQPEMEALQKKYGDNREKLNQEQAKLYKKYNVNMGGMCFSLLITMAISLTVFLTLFSSLKAYGNEKLLDTYQDLDKVVVAKLDERNIEDLTDTEKAELKIDITEEYKKIEEKNSWLWVKNVWKGDTTKSQFVDFETFAKSRVEEGDKEQAKQRYEFITSTVLDGKKDSNGCYVLIIFAVAVSFLTQWLSSKLMSQKGQKMNTMNKVMFAVIPISMAIFAFTSNVVFTLYIITNSIMTAIISTIISFVLKSINKNNGGDVLTTGKKVEVVEYSRNYKK